VRDVTTNIAPTGVDFTKILRAAFPLVDPKSAKNTVKPSVFFMLLGFVHVKAARKMLVKLTPAVNFINIKRVHFLYEHYFGSFFLVVKAA